MSPESFSIHTDVMIKAKVGFKIVLYREENLEGDEHWLVAAQSDKTHIHGYLFYNPDTDLWYESKLDARIYASIESAQAQVLLLKLCKGQ